MLYNIQYNILFELKICNLFVSLTIISVFLFRLNNSEVYVLSGHGSRHFCGTVQINVSDVYNISCDGAVGDLVEITTTFVSEGDKKHNRNSYIHVREVEVYTKRGKLADSVPTIIIMLVPEKIVNLNINTGTTLLLKTIVN